MMPPFRYEVPDIEPKKPGVTTDTNWDPDDFENCDAFIEGTDIRCELKKGHHGRQQNPSGSVIDGSHSACCKYKDDLYYPLHVFPWGPSHHHSQKVWTVPS